MVVNIMNKPLEIPIKTALSILIICLSVLSLVHFLDLKFQQPKEFRIKIYDSSLGSGEYYYATVILNCSLPDFPKEMQIMEVISHNFSEAEATELVGKLFDMTPPLSMKWYDTCMFIKDYVHFVILCYEGGISFLRSSSGGGDFPNPSECKRIADEFLNKIASHGYIPQLAQIEFKRVEPIAYVDERVERMGVSYALKYNGIPTANYGFVVVGIGSQGEIVELRAFWRNVRPGRNVTITISPEEAIKNLGEHWPTEPCSINSSRIKKITINKVELAYYMEAPIEKQDELTPVYLLDISIIKEDNTQTKSYLWIPATNE